MVQVHKDKVTRGQRPGIKAVRTTKVTFGNRRRNAPTQFAKPSAEQKVTGAIHRNIEDIMTARVAHEGGHLRILKAPDNVYEFAKGGARVSDKVLAQRANQIGWRKNKVADREKELKMAMDKDIRKAEKEKLKKVIKVREQEQQEALDRLKKKRDQNTNEVDVADLDVDDVAGDFFDDVIGEDFFENVSKESAVKPEEVGAKNAKGSVLTSKQLQRREEVAKKKADKKKALAAASGALGNQTTTAVPVKRANIKGLHDEAAMKMLDDGF